MVSANRFAEASSRLSTSANTKISCYSQGFLTVPSRQFRKLLLGILCLPLPTGIALIVRPHHYNRDVSCKKYTQRGLPKSHSYWIGMTIKFREPRADLDCAHMTQLLKQFQTPKRRTARGL